MADRSASWSPSGVPAPPRWSPPSRVPSGLFPAPPPAYPAAPSRPTYREPHPVRPGAIAAGAGGAAAWLLLFGLLGTSLPGYAWWTLFAGALAWLVALALVRFGDRGVAVGVAMVTAVGWGIAATAVALRWAGAGDWPLW
ncbi:hypothetical protein SAMN05444365_101819 [Micromonospora pattaloongensis]|uniref:Uncharacterized protein n=1 Tax=Micromonospora pattaloongensis TaxID=405436 RepID=A0A1H3HHN7_9ACTN|nr:hypothetical protein [Micromonospora pattaloongensis]SDY14328.1 hypothetical protein SAMN05444365_101819 [Micromonospora pattaloongensis]